MNSVSVGIDIADVSRFRRRAFRKNSHFYNRIFTKQEIAYCLGRPDPFPHFAARFAAKEAVIKAVPSLGSVSLDVIEVVHSEGKPPHVRLGLRKNGLSAKDISVSLSHAGKYVVACAVYVKHRGHNAGHLSKRG